jgi:hypothetical protein
LGLIDSILKSGDGLRPETAFKVITVDEEYILLGFLGLKCEGQALLKIEGHAYDRLEVKHGRTGRKKVLFFNVDIPMKWIRKTLQKETK